MGTFDELYANLSEDPQMRGLQFEHICKWFLENDPVYAHELKTVWLWNDWPGRWGGDAGIDLVAEDRNGDLWAIQAKAYNSKYRVTKDDINKFLAESGRKVFTYRMLIATTDLIDRIGERTIQQQEKRSGFFRLNDLRAAAVDWPASPQTLRPTKPRKPAKPRPHQKDAIRDVLQGFETSNRGQLIMACGTGKTLTGLFITEKLESNRAARAAAVGPGHTDGWPWKTLVLVPSLSLLKQTVNEWRANATKEFRSLPVCSDATVSNTDDAAVAHTSDLGFPVTTDPGLIATFLRQRTGPPGVVFATYQSSPQIAAAFAGPTLLEDGRSTTPGFDLIIADEAHRVSGPVSSDFATVLDAKALPGKLRLFMTATPRYFTGRVLKAAQDNDFEIASMDDEAKFGMVLHRLSFGEAIERDLLTDYQVVVVGVDDATYREWAEKGALVTRDGKEILSAATLAGQIGLAKAMRRYDLRRTISFHSRVARAQDFAASMPDVLAWMPSRQRPKGKLWSRHASGAMPAGDRYVLLQHLARLDDSERGLLSNARCLAEGVDVPTLDGVAFIDPRRSEVDIVQAVGRAIRKSDAKAVGTIVIPVFIDTDTDPEAALDSSAFKPVWDVIKALRAHDAELGEQLDTLRRQMGRKHCPPKLPGKIHLDVPAAIGRDFSDAFDVRLVEQTTQPWEFWWGLLEKFTEANGHARVPRGYKPDGYQLDNWVTNQRAFRRRGILPMERQRQLERLPGWAWDPHDDQWERKFARLQEFVEANGHARVPRSDKKLGVWVQAQRRKFLKGSLEDERQQRLESIAGWTWDPFVDQWEEGFAHLMEHARIHGHARVPGPYRVNDFNLGAWVSTQRQQFGKGKLDEERRQRLETVAGWTWDPQVQQWEEGFAHLVDYARVNGSAANVPRETFNGFLLGAWVSRQRAARGKDQLSSERVQRLESMPGWTWDEIAARWEEGFSHLIEYAAEHGTTLVPFSYRSPDGLRLGQWINVQRNAYAAGLLSDERRERLEQLAGWSWNSRLQLWEDGYAALRRYIEMNGSAAVPYEGMFEGFALGKWVTTQRRAYNIGKLSEERRERLLRLPGWLWDVKDEQWGVGFAHLFKWVETNGNSALPRDHVDPDDGYPVGQWVNNQRAARRRGKLSEERQRKLEELPDWSWDPKSDAWDRNFEVLTRYVAKHGDSRVPPGCEFEGVRLSSWCVTQRAAGARGQLSESRRLRLETLHGWVWDTFDAQWEKAFGVLLAFVEREGTSLVPQSHREDGFSLGGWVTQQRGKQVKRELEVERQRLLEQLPGWSWDPKADYWEAAFALLCAYQLEHAAAAPRGLVYNGFKLGDWVERQRSAYRKGKLDEVRVQRLESLDVWQWNPKEDQWERGFATLLGYVAEHGDALVPAARVVDGYKLGGWVNTQRLAYLDGTMLPDRCNRLESVTGWSWDPHSDSWNRACELVEAYVREHGHARVPDKYWVDGFALGAWVVAQRMRRRRGSLLPEREMRLSSLPGWSWGKV